MSTTKRIFIILGLFIVAGIVIAGCTQQVPVIQHPTIIPTTSETTPQTSAGMPNPASVNCEKMGGTTEIKKNVDNSEYSLCTFQNGTSCEEWALFRNEGCWQMV